jgi:hypothetical protein
MYPILGTQTGYDQYKSLNSPRWRQRVRQQNNDYEKFPLNCGQENTGTIEDHDQGHLYTNLEVPGLTCPGRGSNPGLPRGKRAL